MSWLGFTKDVSLYTPPKNITTFDDLLNGVRFIYADFNSTQFIAKLTQNDWVGWTVCTAIHTTSVLCIWTICCVLLCTALIGIHYILVNNSNYYRSLVVAVYAEQTYHRSQEYADAITKEQARLLSNWDSVALFSFKPQYLTRLGFLHICFASMQFIGLILLFINAVV